MSLRKIHEEQDYSVELSTNDYTKLKEAFDSIDTDETRTISAGLIHELLQTTIKDNQDFYQDDIKEALDEIGKSVDDNVTFKELIEVVKILLNPKSIIEAFKWFDKDKNGYIDIDEFKCILQMVNGNFSEEEVNEIFVQSDVNKDGKIDYKELVKYWHSQ